MKSHDSLTNDGNVLSLLLVSRFGDETDSVFKSPVVIVSYCTIVMASALTQADTGICRLATASTSEVTLYHWADVVGNCAVRNITASLVCCGQGFEPCMICDRPISNLFRSWSLASTYSRHHSTVVFPTATVYLFVLCRLTLHCHYVRLPLVTEVGGTRMN